MTRRQAASGLIGRKKAREQHRGKNYSDEAWMAADRLTDSPRRWVIDSGANRHMTPDESVFTTK